jgi:hypothetical protein
MSDIMLHHQNVDEAADALAMASNTMHESMTDCMQAVQAASLELEGDLQSAAQTFYQAVANADGKMSEDIANGSNILREMHGLLRDADRNAAGGFHH